MWILAVCSVVFFVGLAIDGLVGSELLASHREYGNAKLQSIWQNERSGKATGLGGIYDTVDRRWAQT